MPRTCQNSAIFFFSFVVAFRVDYTTWYKADLMEDSLGFVSTRMKSCQFEGRQYAVQVKIVFAVILVKTRLICDEIGVRELYTQEKLVVHVEKKNDDDSADSSAAFPCVVEGRRRLFTTLRAG
jgi:hypothetical protein